MFTTPRLLVRDYYSLNLPSLVIACGKVVIQNILYFLWSINFVHFWYLSLSSISFNFHVTELLP